ncbi:uncharacterized protein C9orf57 homolog [Ursus arctos]|uniref:uncharacterized protein C9orf57 homolog n=1 Tax=Ursus arctos TaxID=9644 RepID=UPI002547E1C0|nr:uncharacterized protein C9orf57 homolog [Ursus arctos]
MVGCFFNTIFFFFVRNRRMRRIVFSGVFILLCLLSGKSLRKQTKKRENYLRDSRIAAGVGPESAFPTSFQVMEDTIDVEGTICRLCNLSMPFHGCLLDFGTCRTKPGQYCMKQTYARGGIQWYSILGCTETHDDCFKKKSTSSGMRATYCCHRPLCNF